MPLVLLNPFGPGSPASPAPDRHGRAHAWAAGLFAAAVVAGPTLLLWHLHGLWNPDGAYAYGWAVPLLAAFLLKSRWDDRPEPSAARLGATRWVMLLALTILPARWLQEAAPERGICAWWYAMAAVGISLGLVARAGGTAWVRWFAFPFVFLLTAVPWPHELETIVSDSLMRQTAAATVEVLCLIGVPAAQAGNLVHIENGVIDIDEACSGIRSLQAMVMISLFLGELFRLHAARRLWLLGIGVSITVVANIIRTVVLSEIAFGQGMAALDHYHDTAGMAVLISSLLLALLTAFLLRPKEAPAAATPKVAGASRVGPMFPARLCAGLLAWFVATELGVEIWYRLREPQWDGWTWEISWPQANREFKFIEIPKRSLHLLMCDDARAATWKESGGYKWAVYSIRWNPGNVQAEAAKVHRPDVCLNAEGAIMQRDLGTHVSTVGGLPLPFHAYTFGMNDQTLYVFYCLYEEAPGQNASADLPRFEGADMFTRALQGRRRIGQQSVEIALAGYGTPEAALAAFQERLQELVRRGK